MTLFSEQQLLEWKIAQWGYVNDPIPKSLPIFKKWIDDGKYRPLTYLADHRKELRQDIRNFYPQFQSALVFLFSYAAEKKALDHFFTHDTSWNGLKVASYTLGFDGHDYHHLLKNYLHEIGNSLKEKFPDLEYALTLDIHPVLERDLAHRAGLGWFGKNSMLIDQKEGSFVMIGSLLLNRQIDQEVRPIQLDHCGHCRACLDICPTNAIDEVNRTIEAQKCISTFTIELFDDAPEIEGHVEKGSGEIFGCDLCQDVCPWNKKKLASVVASQEIDKNPKSKLIVDTFMRTPLDDLISKLESLGVREFRRLFAGTSFERSGKKGLLKNLKIFR